MRSTRQLSRTTYRKTDRTVSGPTKNAHVGGKGRQGCELVSGFLLGAFSFRICKGLVFVSEDLTIACGDATGDLWWRRCLSEGSLCTGCGFRVSYDSCCNFSSYVFWPFARQQAVSMKHSILDPWRQAALVLVLTGWGALNVGQGPVLAWYFHQIFGDIRPKNLQRISVGVKWQSTRNYLPRRWPLSL